MSMKKNQKGYTIVELLIAVAILSIVVASVCGFFIVGSRSYAAGNSDINIQQGAQLALNQMSDVLIDTTRSVTYTGFDASGAKLGTALKDAEFTSAPEDKSLVMINGVVEETAPAAPGGAPGQKVDPGNGNKHYHFYWSRQDEMLYYAELDVQPTDVDTTAVANSFPAFDPTNPDWVELASHVTDFSVDLSQVEEKRVVHLALTFVDGTKEYVTSNNVTIRNKVGVNDVELDPVNKKKTLDVIPRDSGVIIEPGEVYHFSTPKVTGENVADRSVKWSVVSADNGETKFIDEDNGILKVSIHEPGGTITVKIETNAVDSEGHTASVTMPVYIKRVREVNLSANTSYKSGFDSFGNPCNIYLVEPGGEYTITATMDGFKLGEVCSKCGEFEIDKQIVNGGGYGSWRVAPVESGSQEFQDSWNAWLRENIQITENEPYHAKFKVSPTANTSNPDNPNQTYGFVIQAISLLSFQNNGDENSGERCYDNWVTQGISFEVVKKDEEATKINGLLQYGDETLIDEIKEDLTTEGHEYVTCIRVVDNTPLNNDEGKKPLPDKILLYFTIDHGANFRIVPDLFDLDLSRSYTFYMQALDPVSKENHKNGNHHQSDSKQEIWDEYINHLNPNKPYGYNGTKYDYRKVYYSVLDKPRAIWDGYEKGKDITLDSVNVYTVSPGGTIINTNEVVPDAYENIWHTSRTQEKMTYSVYVGDGDNRDDWTPLYWFYGDSMSYIGSTSVGGGVGILNIKDAPGNPGNPFFKMENGDRMKLCGNYHIVTGFCYDNVSDRTLTGNYDIIGWQGFSCDGKDKFELPHKLSHYKFDGGVIHVNLNAEFTMDVEHSDDFTGKLLFPLPKEMKNSALFPNIKSTEWQNSNGGLTVMALRDGQQTSENITFTYVRYRYISKDNAWEVEPVRVEYRTWEKKMLLHTYGRYKCEEKGTKWEFLNSVSTVEKALAANAKNFYYENNYYETYFPLPTDDNFPFKGETVETGYDAPLFNSYNPSSASGLIVTCKKNGNEYEIEFRQEKRANLNDPNNHRIDIVSCGVYTWKPGQTEWTWKKRNEDTHRTDLVTNLSGVMINDTECKMYFPLPSESGFPFKDGKTEIECTAEHVVYAMTDVYGENAIQTQYGVNVIYAHSGNTHTITFVNRYYKGQEFGTFECVDGATSWTKK